MEVVTDKDKIEEFLTRGVENVYPDKDWLRNKMLEGKQLTMYLGVDPSGPNLHIGHGVQLMKLMDWQRLGHKAILLIGDFTAMIGDPTDKTATRKKLTRDEVFNNQKNYVEEASNFLDFEGDNKIILKHNSEWLEKLSFKEIVELASHITYAQTIKRSMFQERIKSNKDLFLHEFLYPIMQGYDSVAMDVDGEIGGNDQMFNMLVGRDLMKKLKDKEKFVITSKLLADNTGKKMGKSEGNMVTIADDPQNKFGKIMSWTDEIVPIAFEILTRIPMNEVEEILADHPKDAKMRLAKEIITMYDGADAAIDAERDFKSTFGDGATPENVPETKAKKGDLLSEILVREETIKSKTEFRRLADEGAISVNGERQKDHLFEIQEDAVVKVGKHRFLKITI